MNKKFLFKGKKFPYFNINNERAVEIPLGYYFHYKFGPNIIEVGNVLRTHYPYLSHYTIDLYEKQEYENYENLDILTFKTKRKFDSALSISTCEHTKDPLAAINKVLSLAPKALVTVPLGYKNTTELLDRVKLGKNITLTLMFCKNQTWKEISLNKFRKLSKKLSYDHKNKRARSIAIWTKK